MPLGEIPGQLLTAPKIPVEQSLLAGKLGRGTTDTSGIPPKPTIDPGAGRQWVYDPLYNTWSSESMPEWVAGGGGAGADHYGANLNYQLGLKGLEVDWARVGLDRQRVANEKAQTAIAAKSQAETARANKAAEYEARKQRALDAATGAVSAYLRGTELADARRLASFQEARELLPYMVTPRQKYQAGLGVSDPLAQAASRFGFDFQAQELPKATFQPGKLAETPTSAQIGTGIIGGIKDIRAAGAAGQRGPGS